MRYTYEEARKDMETYVEKMKLAFLEEAYKIQCAWESVQEGIVSQNNDDAYGDGFEDGKRVGYDRGYDQGYAECEREYWSAE